MIASLPAGLSRRLRQHPAGLIWSTLFLAAVFIFSANDIHDSDAWLHLSLGKLIWTLKGLPEHELFTYPSADRPFSYSSWLFGVLCYLAYLLFNTCGVVLFKAAIITAAFFLLLRDALRPVGNHLMAVIVLSAVVILAQSRFVLRPDIFFMLFLGFSIFSLNAYLYEGKKYLYLLPLSHWLWANSHSSISVMAVPFLAFITGGLVQLYFRKRGWGLSSRAATPTAAQLKTLGLVFALSIAASLLSPYFTGQFFHGAQYLATDWYKQEIVELLPPTREILIVLWLVIGITLVSFLLSRAHFSFIHLLLVIPFMVLPFSARRFLFLIAIVAGPVIVRNIALFVESTNRPGLFRGKAAAAFAMGFLLMCWAAIFSGHTPLGLPNLRYRLSFDESAMPRGALDYMDRNAIYGRSLNPFTFGQYITWRGYPGRTVFIDARGYLSGELLELAGRFRDSPAILDELWRRYGFEILLMRYPSTGAADQELRSRLGNHFSHPDWALVHWDDVSMLFLRRGGPYRGLIERDEYRHVHPDMTYAGFQRQLPGKPGLLAELQRNVRETDSSRGRVFLAVVYSSLGRYREAIEAVRPVVSTYMAREAHIIMAHAYKKLGDAAAGLAHLREAMALKEDVHVLNEAARLHLRDGNAAEALGYLERSRELDPKYIATYPMLIRAYRALGRKDEARRTEGVYARLKSGASLRAHFNRGLKAYAEKRYPAAIREFRQVLAADPKNAPVRTNLGFIYFDQQRLGQALEQFGQALRHHPNHANAHYGIALTYAARGEYDRAIAHFQRYVALEPSGYYSRAAKNKIESLSRMSAP